MRLLRHIENVLITLLWGAVLLAAVWCGLLLWSVFADTARADELRILQPSSVRVGGEKFETLRDPYIPQYDGDWQYGAWLGLSLDLVKYGSVGLYYDPTLSFRSANNQIREGALNYEGGIRYIGDLYTVKAYLSHESRHCLECNAQSGTDKRFPVRDSYGAEIEWQIP